MQDEIEKQMKKILYVALFTITPFAAYGQTYDLVRSVNTTGAFLQDTASGDFTQTGTMQINGTQLIRSSMVCRGQECTDINLTDEILAVNSKDAHNALISGSSGDLVPITILSTNPTIIILKAEPDGKVDIEEYRLRQ